MFKREVFVNPKDLAVQDGTAQCTEVDDLNVFLWHRRSPLSRSRDLASKVVDPRHVETLTEASAGRLATKSKKD